LDTGIPKFNECLEDAIESSKNVNDDSYFEKEPTKDEVFKCYEMTFMNTGGMK
jgi:cephalosporin-C deacetylase-like acetyl esterase